MRILRVHYTYIYDTDTTKLRSFEIYYHDDKLDYRAFHFRCHHDNHHDAISVTKSQLVEGILEKNYNERN